MTQFPEDPYRPAVARERRNVLVYLAVLVLLVCSLTYGILR
ncbi:hypothetical protein [Streptomyces sp. NPDC055055]